MIRVLFFLFSVIHAYDFDGYIGLHIKLYDEDAIAKTIDLRGPMQEIIDDVIFSQDCQSTSNALREFSIEEVFVIDTMDSIFDTKLKKLVPGGTLDDLSRESHVFVDYGLWIHRLLEIEHHPSKVEINGHIATITPIFLPR